MIKTFQKYLMFIYIGSKYTFGSNLYKYVQRPTGRHFWQKTTFLESGDLKTDISIKNSKLYFVQISILSLFSSIYEEKNLKKGIL